MFENISRNAFIEMLDKIGVKYDKDNADGKAVVKTAEGQLLSIKEYRILSDCCVNISANEHLPKITVDYFEFEDDCYFENSDCNATPDSIEERKKFNSAYVSDYFLKQLTYDNIKEQANYPVTFNDRDLSAA